MPLPVLCELDPRLTPLTMQPTKFRVIQDAEGVYWIALDGQGYEALARNISAMRLALNEARNIIAYYRACVEEGSNVSQ
jgi:hypothetical protein